MKPAPFDYVRPASLDEACTILAANDGARLIAGGQTLVPLMAMRLARPTLLVDIARLPALAFVRDEGNAVSIGATTRHCVIEYDPIVRAKVPLLAAAMPSVGHAATRARGTIGGSLANADPAAEIALVASVLDATLTYRNGVEVGEISATAFFTGPMMTALPATGCLTSIRFPVWDGERNGIGFHEVSARRGDFAFAAAAAQVALDESGRCRRLAAGVGAITDRPLRLDTVCKAMEGKAFDEAACRDAVSAALAEVEALSDLHATASYRRRVAATLAVRAIKDAFTSAAAGTRHAH